MTTWAGKSPGMTHAPNVPRSPRWDHPAPTLDDLTADDLWHLQEHLTTYLRAAYPDSYTEALTVGQPTERLRTIHDGKRDADLDREESMVPPLRVYTLHSAGGHHSRAVTNTEIAGWVWYETEYPEHGSVGPWPTRKQAEDEARMSDCADWTVAPITHAQLREREREGEIEAVADNDERAAAVIAAIDTLARSEAQVGPDRAVRDAAKWSLESALGDYRIDLRREHGATHRTVWALCMAASYDLAKLRVRKLALADARDKVARASISAAGEISDGG